jgi:hypothetical protein
MELLIDSVFMLQPTPGMSSSWIPMGPVDDTAFTVPLVFTFEGDDIADLQISNPRRQIDIVCHQ